MLKIIYINIQAPLLTIDQDFFKIRVAMASQTELVIQAILIQNSSGLMGPVTFNTGRDFMRFSFPEFTADNFRMSILDIGVAFHAGFYHILAAEG